MKFKDMIMIESDKIEQVKKVQMLEKTKLPFILSHACIKNKMLSII